MILAATNRPEILDPALLRPGRSDGQVVIDGTDLMGREKILKVHARNVKLAPGLDLAVVAAWTPGLVGADLANLVWREREIVAHHEAGHGLVAESRPHADRVAKISIIPRGVAALGYTKQQPTEDRYLRRAWSCWTGWTCSSTPRSGSCWRRRTAGCGTR
jgi:cell division protease FtsH